MANTESIVGTFSPFGETGQTIPLPQAWHPIPATGKHFMRIALVADIPHQPVIRGIKHTVQGEGQLYRTESGGKVATCLADRVNEILTEFFRQLLEFRDR